MLREIKFRIPDWIYVILAAFLFFGMAPLNAAAWRLSPETVSSVTSVDTLLCLIGAWAVFAYGASAGSREFHLRYADARYPIRIRIAIPTMDLASAVWMKSDAG